MNDDDLLRSIVKAARDERASRDPNFERLTRGEATEHELRAIEDRAKHDPEAARMLEVHRPLSSAAHDRIASAILAGGESGASRNAPERATTAPKGEPTGGVVRRLYYVVPALAAAAAIVLFVSFRSSPAIPEYALTVQSASETRASPHLAASNEPVRLHASSTLDVVLRPKEPLAGAVGVRAVLVRGAKTIPWAPAAEVASGGAVRIRGRVDTIVPEASGSWEIVIAVARPDALPSDAELARRATSGDEADTDHRVRYARAKIEIIPEP